MLARINTVTFIGIEVKRVDIQVHIATGGLPCFNIVGLADKAVAESKERVRAAFSSIGLGFPAKRITVNLAPADLPKEGSHFDLGIAIGLLVAMQIIEQDDVESYIVLGELSLDGGIANTNGVLPAAIKANSLSMGLICPQGNGGEAAWSNNKDIIAPNNLIEAISHLTGKQILPPPISKELSDSNAHYLDMRDVIGQKLAKRALEIAAAGKHNLLMIGPPGSGKSMLAKRLPGITPSLTIEEILEISIIASVAGELNSNAPLITRRPFREPHCSSSMPAIIGGGKNAKPGEITLAHLGILFLDELPEFQRVVLESLRQPIESGYVNIARANMHVTYPAKFQLIAAMNPCKCGYYGTRRGEMCKKAPKCAEDYQSQISGPIFDRFDLQVNMGLESNCEFNDELPKEESSSTILQRIIKAREIQKQRYKTILNNSIVTNSEIDGEILNKVILLDDNSKNLLKSAAKKFDMSMRNINRLLKVARTISDLEGREHISRLDIAEALNYKIIRS